MRKFCVPFLWTPSTRAGRLKDKLIAEKIMGWHSDRMVIEWYDEREQSTGYCQEAEYPDEINKYKYWNPTADLNQAIKAYEKLASSGRMDCLYISRSWPEEYCTIMHTEEDSAPFFGISRTLSEAICDALLEAVEKVKENND